VRFTIIWILLSLLTDFVNDLYCVCVPVRWKFVPDPRYPWMTLEIQDAIRRHDRMRTGTVVFHNAKRQVANMMRYTSARFVERDFDPRWPQRVLWSNFCRLGFCNSSDFSSSGVGVEDFAELLRECSCSFCPDTNCFGKPWWIFVSSY
jgi:hypothetical protein